MNREITQLKLGNEKLTGSLQIILDQLQGKIAGDDYNLVEELLKGMVECYKYEVDSYIRYYDSNADLKQPESDPPLISICTERISDILKGRSVNYLPSKVKGRCERQCVVVSNGNWELNEGNFRNDILKYWYRCFYSNRFTLILTESWQSVNWRRMLDFIKAYTAEQEFSVRGNIERVEHTVVVISYSEETMELRRLETSI